MERLSDEELEFAAKSGAKDQYDSIEMARELLELRHTYGVRVEDCKKEDVELIQELLDTRDAYAYEYSIVSERLAAAERVVDLVRYLSFDDFYFAAVDVPKAIEAYDALKEGT